MIDTLSLLADNQSDRFDSRYRVVMVAVQRAKYIMQGAKTSQVSKYTKDASIALEEVLQGKVPYLVGEEARHALKEVRKSGEQAFDQSILVEPDENTKEIKQQLSVYIDDSPKPQATEHEG